MQPYKVNGTELGAQEWHDYLFLRYGLDPPDLPYCCDGCNAKLTICHALDCKRGGLVTTRHKELWDGVSYLDGKAFTPSHVRKNTLIFAGCAVKRTKDKTAGTIGSTNKDGATPLDATEQKGYLLICDHWQNGTDSVHDILVMNTKSK